MFDFSQVQKGSNNFKQWIPTSTVKEVDKYFKGFGCILISLYDKYVHTVSSVKFNLLAKIEFDRANKLKKQTT